MRIEIVDDSCMSYTINTFNPTIAGLWFAEQCKYLMSADARIGNCRLRIWPDTHDEMDTIGQVEMKMTQENLLDLAGSILEVSQRMADKEEPCSGYSPIAKVMIYGHE